MGEKYLVSIPAAGGRYGLTIGASHVIVKKIRKTDPNAVIHYSGISSGAIVAVLAIIMDEREPVNGSDRMHSKLHRELIEMIKNEGEWEQGISNYFQNNEYFFRGLTKFVKHNIIDINKINDKIHIGYCKLSPEHRLEFKVVSRFNDVDDLIGALLASSHYSWVLKNSHYYEYRGDKCVDGIFMHDRFPVPGYKNINIDDDIFVSTDIRDSMLGLSHEKYISLYKMGKRHQRKKNLEFFETDDVVNTSMQTLVWDFLDVIHTLIYG